MDRNEHMRSIIGDRESGGDADGSVVEGNGRLLLQRLKLRWLNLLDDGGKGVKRKNCMKCKKLRLYPSR